MRKEIPVVFGISSTKLTKEERELFAEYEPEGFILFSRNIESSEQLMGLTKQLRDLYDTKKTIYVDQEGGRVQRIKPPIGIKKYPSPRKLLESSNDDDIIKNIQKNYFNLAKELKEFDIDSPCAPVCDILYNFSHEVIGDRSFGTDAAQVIKNAKAAIIGIKEAGCIPFIKHIPGHGRANMDSHFELPIIDTPLEELENTDFKVFKELSDEVDHAMTAHIIYSALDADNTATTSSIVIKYIRDNIGFKGAIFSDDISMLALHGKLGIDISMIKNTLKLINNSEDWHIYNDKLKKTLDKWKENYNNEEVRLLCDQKLLDLQPIFCQSIKQQARKSLEAGCDFVLHCNGKLDEMQAICELF